MSSASLSRALLAASFLIFSSSAVFAEEIYADPLVATPDVYKVLFEDAPNARVRGHLSARTAGNWHGHPRYFVYVVEPGKLQVENDKGELAAHTRPNEKAIGR